MVPALPPPEERQALLAAQAHRFPQLFYFDVIGDGGEDLKLPILLGNPSGACKMPSGQKADDAWARNVRATFKNDELDNEGLVADSVLWPDQITWASLVNRWPALPVPVGKALRQKYGGSFAQFTAPMEAPPASVVAELKKDPARVWRRFSPPRALPIDIVLHAPDLTAWRMFEKAMGDPATNYAERIADMAAAHIAWSSTPAAEMFDRWCGLPLQITAAVSHLAGIAAEFEAGEF